MYMKHRKPCIGIALGSGSARGWSHIGVLQALAEMDIHPEVVCGCSIGAVVGAAYASNHLDRLESWVTSLTKLNLLTFFELNVTLNGVVRKEKLLQYFHDHVCERHQTIESLPKRFATVAANLDNGREVWFTEGMIMDAVWASMALPGLFPAFRYNDSWLVDGGVLNPVPVSLCRALGADIVIAVNLNGITIKRKVYGKNNAAPKAAASDIEEDSAAITPVLAETMPTATPASMLTVSSALNSSKLMVSNMAASLKGYSSLLPLSKSDTPLPPSLIDIVARSINIMQDKITRSRMAGDPPELLLNPRVSEIGLMDFHRAAEAIAEGRESVKRMQSELEALFA